MIPAIAQSLPVAVGILLSSLPLTVVPLILQTREDRWALTAFMAGWTTGFLLLGIAVLLLADTAAPDPEQPSTWIAVVRILLGALLFWLAFKQWRGRPGKGETPAMPGWMSNLQNMAPLRAAGLGLLLAAVNPKYTVLIASGTLSIATATYQLGAQLGALVVFMLISSLGVFAPFLLSWALGEKASTPLKRFQAWLVRHNALIMTVVLLSLGVVVTWNGVSHFL